jgi:gluconolactonase
MTVELVADGLGFTEGPAWLPEGRVALTSINHGCVYVVDPDGGVVERIVTGGGPNGLAIGSDGAMYVAQNGGIFGGSGPAEPGVQVIRDGAVTYLADGMGAPNDVVFGPDGRLWVTDTRCEIDFFHPDETKPGWVWAIDTATGAKELMLDSGPVFINGLGFTPDGARLLVTTTSAAQLVAYSMESLGATQGQVVCTFDNGWPDGMAVDPDGNMWVALTGGHRLDCVAPDGQILRKAMLASGALPTNVCLSGERPDELYVTASFHQALVRIRL